MAIEKKIIAFDLDGTLTPSKSPMEKTMGETFSKLLTKYTVAVISGASFLQFKKQFLSMLGDIPKDHLILLPGDGSQCFMWRNNNWEKVYEDVFPQSLKEQVITKLQAIIKKEQFEIPTEHFGDYVEDRESEVTFSALGQNAPLALKESWDPKLDKRKKIVASLKESFPSLSFSIGGSTSIDILPKGSSKAQALLRLLLYVGLPKTDMLFLGDAVFPLGNDYSVIESGIETIKVTGPEETEVRIKELLS